MSNWLNEFLDQGLPLMPATKLAHELDLICDEKAKELADTIDVEMLHIINQEGGNDEHD